MLTLTDFMFKSGNLLSFTVQVECDPDRAYSMTVENDGDIFPAVSSNIPDEYRIYKRQASVVLQSYVGKELPETVVSAWC